MKEFIKYVCEKETSLQRCENFDVIDNSIRYTNPIGTRWYTPEEFLELDRVKALLSEWEDTCKVSSYRTDKSQAIIKVKDANDNFTQFYSAAFFDWFCDTNTEGERIWLHDFLTGTVVKGTTTGTACIAYTYAQFFLVMADEINELFSEYIKCLDNVKWTKPTPTRSNKDKFIYDSEIAFLDAEQRGREEYINRLIETHKA
jgi:hypothetical protein